jgi:hypothetical protein
VAAVPIASQSRIKKKKLIEDIVAAPTVVTEVIKYYVHNRVQILKFLQAAMSSSAFPWQKVSNSGESSASCAQVFSQHPLQI